MSRMLDLAEIKAGQGLPLNSQFFDIFDGETLVAHFRLPGVYDREHRGQVHVTLYALDRTVHLWSGWSTVPLTKARRHARALRLGVASPYESGARV